MDAASKNSGGHLAVVDDEAHGVEEAIAAVALGMRKAGQVGLARGADGRHYILRATEVRLHPAPWDEQMVMRVRNLIAYEKLERVLRELMEQLLLTKTHVSIDQGALQQLRVPSVSEYSQSSFVSD